MGPLPVTASRSWECEGRALASASIASDLSGFATALVAALPEATCPRTHDVLGGATFVHEKTSPAVSSRLRQTSGKGDGSEGLVVGWVVGAVPLCRPAGWGTTFALPLARAVHWQRTPDGPWGRLEPNQLR